MAPVLVPDDDSAVEWAVLKSVGPIKQRLHQGRERLALVQLVAEAVVLHVDLSGR